MDQHYLPTPIWNNQRGCWEAIDTRHGYTIMDWPQGFDPARLPTPEYRDGDRIQFVRDETCAREGIVKLVRLRGGAYGPLDNPESLFEEWYCNPDNITYIVTARGHDHVIRPWTILGRFISPRSL